MVSGVLNIPLSFSSLPVTPQIETNQPLFSADSRLREAAARIPQIEGVSNLRGADNPLPVVISVDPPDPQTAMVTDHGGGRESTE